MCIVASGILYGCIFVHFSTINLNWVSALLWAKYNQSLFLLKLVCADISLAELADFISSAVLLLGSLLLTGVSYMYIIITILRIPSVQGRQKAFSTCVSHITVVTLYYGSSIFIYVRPKKGNVLDVNKFATVLNTIVTPMLNPFIYSLRNEKVKESLRDAFNKYIGKFKIFKI